MPNSPGRYAAAHGCLIVLFSCLISGALHSARLVEGNREAHGNASDGTRVAHAGGVSNGLLALGLGAAAASGALVLPPHGEGAAVLGAWLNAVAYLVAFLGGRRGLGPVCISANPPFLWCGAGANGVFFQPFGVLANAMFVAAVALVTYALAGAAFLTLRAGKPAATPKKRA
jgi:hypothetical protein